MAETARRAAAKPARGGVANVLFLQASLETMSDALNGVATRITVNYPWGSLLKAVALPDLPALSTLAGMARAGAALDVLVNMQPLRDAAYAGRLGLADAAILNGEDKLRGPYHHAGFTLRSLDNVTGRLLHATRWGSQLHHAQREVARIVARKA
jgi:16S rRNA (adenine(1408)-N(1))-methyltransferase